MKTHVGLLQQCELDIRNGKGHLVARRLSDLERVRIHRSERLPLAKLCDRAGQTSLGLKILAPVVYPEKGLLVDPTPQEIAEYAALLQRIGSTTEAMTILQRVSDLPEALLYRAFCHFSRWEYPESIPLLQKYLTSSLDPYPHLIGRVNLAAAQVATNDLLAASQTIDRLIQEARAADYRRLLGNCLELRAQVYIKLRSFNEARECLHEADSILGSEDTFDRLFVRKWHAIIQSLESGDPNPIAEFRKIAFDRKHWESVRESDRYTLMVKDSSELYSYLMFGTPFPWYRSQIASELNRSQPNRFFVLGRPGGLTWDISTGEMENGSELKPGGKLHQIVEILLRDLYRPIRLGSLFSALFPDERFNIFSSPDRIHQLLRRTRRTFEDGGLPLRIHERQGNYSLEIAGSIQLRLPYERLATDSRHLQLRKLREFFPNGEIFSTETASERLQVNPATFQRLALWAIEDGQLERIRTGRSIRYRLVSGVQLNSRAA